MSILIKGAKIPETCEECPIVTTCEECHYELVLEGEDFVPIYVKDSCPLVEISPHGDLIDKDKLINVLFDLLDNSDKPVHDMLLEVETAPTVIENEE